MSVTGVANGSGAVGSDKNKAGDHSYDTAPDALRGTECLGQMPVSEGRNSAKFPWRTVISNASLPKQPAGVVTVKVNGFTSAPPSNTISIEAGLLMPAGGVHE